MFSRLLDSAIYHGTRLVAPRLASHPVPLPLGAAYVSFTFDDFPASAAAQGAPILERHGVRGTFYVAMALSGADDGFSPEQLERLYDAGHEIGCHTHRHMDCFAADDARVLDDVVRNAEAMERVLPGARPRQFAFPYGRFRPSHKALLGHRFDSLRSIFPGVHRDEADLHMLLANKLFSADGSADRALSLIHNVAERGGWLVLFTHDVSDAPTPYGVRPAELDCAVARAVDLGLDVLPVGEVVRRLQPQRPAAEAGATTYR